MKAIQAGYPSAGVYGEEIDQVFKSGDFLVKLVEGEHSRELGRRYKRTNRLDISYYHANNAKALKVAESLTEILEYITINKILYRSTGMKHVFNANVLHFYLNYNYFVMKNEVSEPTMNTLKMEG
ncbi:hypothetical protein NV379_23265 [Paenibacillus sp. N1-5-1-14]|nr:hypothetical protein [Paenibacillus radicibacter]